ncbi:hypothetical protein E6C60_1986 [Paenibacillus algicola]|uniref:Uncharacterized protein n=1 Tax=Paenibacillus algicola TaxID=2565926 RepID=A0A4P8XMF3_9BACL|nr:hypothetical protein [Paenibacillus algicola]QCT02701.1 hypothetical protein E6C60_1986 [Paenibacillus algicola]
MFSIDEWCQIRYALKQYVKDQSRELSDYEKLSDCKPMVIEAMQRSIEDASSALAKVEAGRSELISEEKEDSA